MNIRISEFYRTFWILFWFFRYFFRFISLLKIVKRLYLFAGPAKLTWCSAHTWWSHARPRGHVDAYVDVWTHSCWKFVWSHGYSGPTEGILGHTGPIWATQRLICLPPFIPANSSSFLPCRTKFHLKSWFAGSVV